MKICQICFDDMRFDFVNHKFVCDDCGNEDTGWIKVEKEDSNNGEVNT